MPWSPRYPGAKLVGEPDIQDDRVNNALSIAATYAVPKLATERDGNWFVRFLPTNMRGTLVAPPSAARSAPLKLQHFPYEASYTFEVKFPDDVSVISDPRAQSVHNKHFSYTIASSFRGNLAKHSVELRMLAGKVEVADLQKYAEDARAAVNLASGAIVVPKRAIKAVASAKAAKKDFAQTVRERVQETVDKTSQAIKSGKLAGADLASSYCLRGAAHADLGLSDKAIADANEAMKLTPNAPATLSCRAYAYFAAGEFEKSVADYAKAIALGDTDAKALQQRGIAKFYAGRLEDAADDFARAAEDSSDRERQVYSDLWLAWTHLRLGKALPEALLKRAGEEFDRRLAEASAGRVGRQALAGGDAQARRSQDRRRAADGLLRGLFLSRPVLPRPRRQGQGARVLREDAAAQHHPLHRAHRGRLRAAAAGGCGPGGASHDLVDCEGRSRQPGGAGPKCRRDAACRKEGRQQAGAEEAGVLGARSLEAVIRVASATRRRLLRGTRCRARQWTASEMMTPCGY